MTPEERQCELTTHHAQLGETSSCWCGFKKYPKKKEPGPPRCPFCGSPPDVVSQFETLPPMPKDVCCVTEGCAAFSNVVTLENWSKRAPHEQEVMRIPADCPIFVLQARDSLSLTPIYLWVEKAEKFKVSSEKINSALARSEEFQSYQRANGSKVPD